MRIKKKGRAPKHREDESGQKEKNGRQPFFGKGGRSNIMQKGRAKADGPLRMMPKGTGGRKPNFLKKGKTETDRGGGRPERRLRKGIEKGLLLRRKKKKQANPARTKHDWC